MPRNQAGSATYAVVSKAGTYSGPALTAAGAWAGAPWRRSARARRSVRTLRGIGARRRRHEARFADRPSAAVELGGSTCGAEEGDRRRLVILRIVRPVCAPPRPAKPARASAESAVDDAWCFAVPPCRHG